MTSQESIQSVGPKPVTPPHHKPAPVPAPLQPMSFDDMVKMQLLADAKKALDAAQGDDDQKGKSLLPKFMQDIAMAASNLDQSGNKLQEFMKGVAINNYMMQSLNQALQSISSYPALKAYLESLRSTYCSSGTSGPINSYGAATVDYLGLVSKADAFVPNGNDSQQEQEENSELSIIQNGASSVGTQGQVGIALRGKFATDETNEQGSYSGVGQVFSTISGGTCMNSQG